jgi:hypothetical protein
LGIGGVGDVLSAESPGVDGWLSFMMEMCDIGVCVR